MAKVIDLTSLLHFVKQEVASTKDQDKYEWLRIQAAIEAMMADGKRKIVVNGATEGPKRKTVAVRA